MGGAYLYIDPDTDYLYLVDRASQTRLKTEEEILSAITSYLPPIVAQESESGKTCITWNYGIEINPSSVKFFDTGSAYLSSSGSIYFRTEFYATLMGN